MKKQTTNKKDIKKSTVQKQNKTVVEQKKPTKKIVAKEAVKKPTAIKTLPQKQNKAGDKTSTVVAAPKKETLIVNTVAEKKKGNIFDLFIAFCFGVILSSLFYSYVYYVTIEPTPAVLNIPRPCREAIQRQKIIQPPCRMRVLKRVTPFNENEYLAYKGQGNASLKGNICANLPKGIACPNKPTEVFINPVTSYSNEWYNRHWVGNAMIENPDNRAYQYNKKVLTDAAGNFLFANLKAGEYYIGVQFFNKKHHKKRCLPVRLGAKVVVNQETTVNPQIVFKGKPCPRFKEKR